MRCVCWLSILFAIHFTLELRNAAADVSDTSLEKSAIQAATTQDLGFETGEIIPVQTGPIKRIRLGLAGAYKLGRWTPLQVDFEFERPIDAGWLRVEAADPDGVGCVYETPLDTADTSRMHRVDSLIKIGRRQGILRISLGDSHGVWAECALALEDFPAVATGQQVVIALGDEWGVQEALGQRLGPPAERVAYRRLEDGDVLPTEFLGYDSADAIVIATGNLTRLTSVSTRQWKALQDWVQRGGKMIACVATHGDELVAPQMPLAWFVPGKYAGTSEIRQTTGIEQFASARRVEVNRNRISTIPTLTLTDPIGNVESAEGYGNSRRPTVIRFAAGMGQGIFVAYDLDRAPFVDWSDRAKLATRLCDLVLDPVTKVTPGQTGIGPVAHLGFDDLVGQLRRALDRFVGVRNVSFGWIAGLTAVYLLVIGPLDYWFVRKLGRPNLTWLTFPLTVVGFTVLATALTSQWKGNQLLTRHVTLVDADLVTRQVRGTSWAHVYCPNSQRLSIDIRSPETSSLQHITSWQGLPGSGFGGLDRTDRVISFRDPYQLAFQLSSRDTASGGLTGFPIATHSSRAFIGQWWEPLRLPETPTELFASKDSVISGRVTNPFPTDLDDAYILFDRWAYKVGRFPRSATLPISERVGTDLQSLLTKREFVKGSNVAQPWRVDSMELDRILQLMSFYDAAKGRDYTQLQHRFEQQIDWSDHLTANGAVLWGRSAKAPIDWLINESTVKSDDTLTYYRFLIPVKRRGA